MVEALVFQNMTDSQAMESHNYEPPKQFESEAITWLLEPSLLIEEAVAIDDSENYRLMHHYSWGQETLPVSLAATFNIVETDLQGSIKVYAKQLLFANLDLEYKGYRLTEKRRLKLNEKHFFDHPKFGVLIQVSRLEKTEGELEQSLEAELSGELESSGEKEGQLQEGQQQEKGLQNTIIKLDES